jgi:hypothetical protein
MANATLRTDTANIIGLDNLLGNSKSTCALCAGNSQRLCSGV